MMRYRRLDSNGDMVFGQGASTFLKDSPETVAQAVKTRLGLIQGEFFLDTSAGVPYKTKVVGKNTMTTYDLVIQDAIRNTPGVQQVVSYASVIDPTTRRVSISCTVDTKYGKTTITTGL